MNRASGQTCDMLNKFTQQFIRWVECMQYDVENNSTYLFSSAFSKTLQTYALAPVGGGGGGAKKTKVSKNSNKLSVLQKKFCKTWACLEALRRLLERREVGEFGRGFKVVQTLKNCTTEQNALRWALKYFAHLEKILNDLRVLVSSIADYYQPKDKSDFPTFPLFALHEFTYGLFEDILGRNILVEEGVEKPEGIPSFKSESFKHMRNHEQPLLAFQFMCAEYMEFLQKSFQADLVYSQFLTRVVARVSDLQRLVLQLDAAKFELERREIQEVDRFIPQTKRPRRDDDDQDDDDEDEIDDEDDDDDNDQDHDGGKNDDEESVVEVSSFSTSSSSSSWKKFLHDE